MKVHPQLIFKNGRPEFVVLPYAEYQKIIALLEDLDNLLDE